MNDFIIYENKDEQRFYVIPSENYLSSVLEEDDYFLPYDSNWEFYKIYKMTPYDFVEYIEKNFSAAILKLKQFPYMNFYFKNNSDAENFLSDFNSRRK